jgi:hypothetical protein
LGNLLVSLIFSSSVLFILNYVQRPAMMSGD